MAGFSDVISSYGRCLHNGRFIEAFYQRLMASDPVMPGMFARTDMSRQHLALRRGISTAIAYAEGSGIVRRTVDQMARIHARGGHAPVAPHLHEKWLESILHTVREHDPMITGPLIERWRLALRPIIAHFSSLY